jgi:hypothetical protein
VAKALSPHEAIRAALARRRPGASICPTDAARLMGEEDWRAALPAVHAAARELAAKGQVLLTRRGLPVTEPRGAYRIVRAAGGSQMPQR